MVSRTGLCLCPRPGCLMRLRRCPRPHAAAQTGGVHASARPLRFRHRARAWVSYVSQLPEVRVPCTPDARLAAQGSETATGAQACASVAPRARPSAGARAAKVLLRRRGLARAPVAQDRGLWELAGRSQSPHRPSRRRADAPGPPGAPRHGSPRARALPAAAALPLPGARNGWSRRRRLRDLQLGERSAQRLHPGTRRGHAMSPRRRGRPRQRARAGARRARPPRAARAGCGAGRSAWLARPRVRSAWTPPHPEPGWP
mmetsp:Transcript_3545/g.10334  ORF Transcript_3545/g.10334 Transcript_3545/m.10334 type:complete len:258 (+) Transcript_3545:337-1110(+)